MRASFAALIVVADRLEDPSLAPPLMARFEERLLAEAGFALDLSQCAATGSRENLIYVSPKSGRAVSASAGEPWRDKLLPLPAFFLAGDGAAPTAAELDAAFRLTGHFLLRDLFQPRGQNLPELAPRVSRGGASVAVVPHPEFDRRGGRGCRGRRPRLQWRVGQYPRCDVCASLERSRRHLS